MRKQVILLLVLVILASWLMASESQVIRQVNKLNKSKDYAKALELLDKGLTQYGESAKLLALKTGIFMKLNKYDEALETAIKRVKASERKSPWHCLEVSAIYLKLGDKDKAFLWVDKAVERGFLSYTELYDAEEFRGLRDDARLEKIVQKIKDKIGIGKPAKDFAVKLFPGNKEAFVLSKQKGKVVLVDFWATWCKPCVKGIHHLKEYYREHKAEGFEVIGISLDSDQKALEEYLAREKLEWKIAFSGDAWFDKTAKYYKVNLIPSYWLIDRKGVLRYFGIPLRDKETMKKAIETLIAEK